MAMDMLIEELKNKTKILEDGAVQIESDFIRDFLANATQEDLKKIEPQPCGGCGGGQIR